MADKRQHVESLYHGDSPPPDLPEVERLEASQPYRHLGDLRTFTGSHPALMADLIAAQDWTFVAGIERQPPRWVRYLRMLISCPRDSIRIFVSRLMLTWNTRIRSPKRCKTQ